MNTDPSDLNNNLISKKIKDTDSQYNSNIKRDSKITLSNHIINQNSRINFNSNRNSMLNIDNNININVSEDPYNNKLSNPFADSKKKNETYQKIPLESFESKPSNILTTGKNCNSNIKKEKEQQNDYSNKDLKETFNESPKEQEEQEEQEEEVEEEEVEEVEEKIFKLKKLYEEQDVSIVGCITLMENLLNYIIASKSYEENKIHTLISNMVPFGNIIETNINFMLESLNFLNQRLFNSNALFSHSEKKSHSDQEKIKIPGWVTKIPTHYSENLNITIKEELRFVKHGKDNYYNIVLCDISCLAELSRNCEITLPIKESKTNYLGNLRIHPCAKLENQNILNDATRIIFIPPHDEFKMGVFEIENFDQEKLPIRANFCLKESAQNEVKMYLKVIIDENIISKFEYFFISIPLGHFGIIIDTKIMVQVGEVSLINNKTTLHWDLQNKVFDKIIVLSGTVNYMPRGKDTITKDDKKEKHIDKVTFF
jgi:hypothetical protein